MNDDYKNIIRILLRHGFTHDEISPNAVAAIAFRLGLNLGSSQVVYVSDNSEDILKEGAK